MVNWSALAQYFVERVGAPSVLLDPLGQVLFVASSAERLLGWQSSSASGADWISRYVAPRSADLARRWFKSALGGTLRNFEVEVSTRRGPSIARFEARPVGESDGQALLLTVEEVRPLDQSADLDEHDYDYSVTGLASGQMSLTSLWRAGGSSGAADGVCHEVLHGRAKPCDHCPLRSGQAEQLVSVRSGPAGFVLTTARIAGEDGANISVRRMSNSSVGAVFQARLDQLADRGGLSKRERTVLRQLMDGRPAEQIANELGISPRTVKFHQANVLQKLGADSRADLMRLLF